MSDEDYEEAATDEPTVEIEEDASAALDGNDQAEDTNDEDREAGPDEEPVEKPKRPRRGVQKKIDKLTKRVREQERLITDLQRPRAEVRPAPDRDQFDDYEQYIEAKVDHQADRRIAELENKQNERNAHQGQQDAVATFERTRDDAVDAGVDKYADFEEVALSENLEISPTMAEALLASNQGQDLWYHLGKNPAKASRISNMSEVHQVLAIGELAVALKTAKQPSNAPRTTKSVGSRGSGSSTPNDKSNIKEWMSKRNKQVRG
jgi:hypothetical protein|tara:strand:+ start:1585 stop:2373 length:789 start_codon:yes stop_codon:yes gene_type:complete